MSSPKSSISREKKTSQLCFICLFVCSPPGRSTEARFSNVLSVSVCYPSSQVVLNFFHCYYSGKLNVITQGFNLDVKHNYTGNNPVEHPSCSLVVLWCILSEKYKVRISVAFYNFPFIYSWLFGASNYLT